MTPFAYHRPDSLQSLLDTLAQVPQAGLLAGGTCLLDLMKQGVERPQTVIDLNFVSELGGVALMPFGALRLGAAATLSHVARRADVRAGWPLLHQAILSGLTPQLRNAASIGGNLMQRPRCIYFREPDFDCNKRRPGSGCAAQAGVHFAHAIFGGAEASTCIAVHPSDLCVALTALDAEATLSGPGGATRRLPIADLHRLPGEDPTRETTLRPGELITAIELAPQRGGGAYLKGPEEGFALASCAALLGVKNGQVDFARIVLGGVAHRPWRVRSAENILLGNPPTPDLQAQAIASVMAEAATDVQTAFRLALLRGVMTECFDQALAAAGARA